MTSHIRHKTGETIILLKIITVNIYQNSKSIEVNQLNTKKCNKDQLASVTKNNSNLQNTLIIDKKGESFKVVICC